MMGAVATRESFELTYDAPLTAVSAMLMAPDFREQVRDAQHAIRRDVTVSPDAGGMKVVIDSALPAEDVPSVARRFVGDEIHLVQTEQWADPEDARVEILIPGKPGEVTGTMTLREQPGDPVRTMQTVDLELRVNIPLLGGKIETLIAEVLRKAFAAENEVGRRYLAG